MKSIPSLSVHFISYLYYLLLVLQLHLVRRAMQQAVVKKAF